MRLCLIGHSAEWLLGDTAGGSERQLALLATHMAHRGHHVTIVVPGFAGKEADVHGVELRSGRDPARGPRFLRAFTYRFPHLRRVLADVDADAYYARGFSLFTPSVVSAARAAGAVSLVAMASDRDLFADSSRYHFALGGPLVSRATGRLGHEYIRRRAVRRASCVVVQNGAQGRACAAAGLPNHLVPSIVLPVPERLCTVPASVDAVWVGNVGYEHRRPKGVTQVADLAERLPNVSFAIVGNLNSPHLKGTLARLHSLPNVTLDGFMDHDRTLERIASARVVLNTSPSEGFSNVMLEGWSLCKPTVSLAVDPSDLLSDYALGICAAGNLERMAALLGALLRDDGMRSSMGEAAHEYVSRVHGPDAVCDCPEELIEYLHSTS